MLSESPPTPTAATGGQPERNALAAPLRVDGVGVSAGGRRILDGIDLALFPGEMCVLIGPSGAGKSTLIKVLLGLREADAGTVRVGGGAVEGSGPAGYVPQDDALHRTLTVRRELEYAAVLRLPAAAEHARAAAVAQVLEQVGLAEQADVRIRRLSGGQRKRVALAIELLTRPPLLILDEPTSGLDPGLEARTMALLSEVAGAGRIVLVATHAMESLDLADALCVLVGGRVAYFGPPRGALAHFRVERYAALFAQLDKQPPSSWALLSETDPDQRAFLRRPGPRTGAGAGDPGSTRPEADDALERLKARVRGEAHGP